MAFTNSLHLKSSGLKKAEMHLLQKHYDFFPPGSNNKALNSPQSYKNCHEP